MITYFHEVEYDDVTFNVEFTATPYRREQVSGPPENCYPAEGGEVEIVNVYLGDDEVQVTLSEPVIAHLQAACELEAAGFEPDFNEPEYDDSYREDAGASDAFLPF